MSWALYQDEELDTIDIVPLADVRYHLHGIDCHCRPRRDPQAQGNIIHNAWDGREEYELGHQGRTQ